MRFRNTYVLAEEDDATPWLQGGSRSNAASLLNVQVIDDGSWSGTLAFEGTLMEGTSTAGQIFPVYAVPADDVTGATTATAAGKCYRVDSSGIWVRVRASAVSAGSVTIVTSAVDG